MPLADRIEEIARPIVERNNAYIIDVDVRGEHGGKVAEIFVDADEGVTAQLCEGISKELSRVLDAADLLRGRYYLVVSSPGIDRPLKFPRQFPKNIGRKLSVKVRGRDAIENLQGTLLESSAEEILLGVNGTNIRRIRFQDMVEARVNPAW